MALRRTVALVLCAAVLFAAKSQAVEYDFVDTPLGRIQGLKTAENGTEVSEYLGIPFARPPVGSLRFSRPQPYGPFKETFEATKFGAVCGQDVSVFNLVRSEDEVSEDCLTLNVYVPHPVATSAPRSVMIFIYGGGFLQGASSTYESQALAHHGDVIVVTFNYRLGLLGFLNSGLDEAPGNVGLLDQRMAIQWVKDNIASFGGNPQSLTIFGESAGGASVSAQSLSPLNLGLFQRAIAQSGTLLCPWSFDYEPEKTYEQTVSFLNCSRDSKPEEMECLQSLPWESFTKGPLTMAGLPTIDNHFLHDNPYNMASDIRAGKPTKSAEMFASVDYISGVNSQEGQSAVTFLSGAFQDSENKMDFGKGISSDLYQTVISSFFNFFTKTGGSSAPLLAEVASGIHTSAVGQPMNDKDRLLQIQDLTGDLMFVAPHLEMMKLRAMLPRRGRSYAYYLDQKQSVSFPVLTSLLPDWAMAGTNHGDDLSYIFGLPLTDKSQIFEREGQYSEGDTILSLQMMKMWSNFAKTGEPDPDVWEDHPLAHRTLQLSHTKGVVMKSTLFNECTQDALMQVLKAAYKSGSLPSPQPVELPQHEAPGVPKDEL